MESSLQPPLFERDVAPITLDMALTPEVLEELAERRGRLILMIGSRSLLSLGHLLIAWRLLHQEPVVLIDGANCIDLYLISRMARANRQAPGRLLTQLQISRAFSMHQLEAVITERLESRLRQGRPLAVIAGLLDLFNDEDVPQWEARASLKKVTGTLRRLADQGYQIVALAPDLPMNRKGRDGLLSLVIPVSDRLFAFSESDGTSALKDVTAEHRQKQWKFPTPSVWRGQAARR